MSLRDIVVELRSGTPDAEKAARWLRYAGYACFLAAAWNAVFTFFDSEGMSELPIPPYFAEGLFILAATGVLFLISSRGVAEKEPEGVTKGQVAIVLTCALIAAFIYWMADMPGRMGFGQGNVPGGFDLFWPLACVLVSMQFFLPAYFALGYLQRLKGVLAVDAVSARTMPPPAPSASEDNQDIYCHALLPFGVHITFYVVLATGMLAIFLLSSSLDAAGIHGAVFPIFLVLFLGPVLYNYIPSPFQKQREARHVATGGGSIFFLNGTWPFFRLLVYADGIEVRFFLHAWFIPYTKLESISLSRNVISKALLICSDLPKVPSRIRFFSLKKKVLLEKIEACRKGRAT